MSRRRKRRSLSIWYDRNRTYCVFRKSPFAPCFPAVLFPSDILLALGSSGCQFARFPSEKSIQNRVLGVANRVDWESSFPIPKLLPLSLSRCNVD